MKTIKITFERLREILKAAEQNKRYPIHLRTYKINPFNNFYLKVLFKKNENNYKKTTRIIKENDR